MKIFRIRCECGSVDEYPDTERQTCTGCEKRLRQVGLAEEFDIHEEDEE